MQKDRKFANTLGRGLSILRAFRAGDTGLSHAEIALRTGLPKPTVSRLTYTLCSLGYLSHEHRNSKFRLGPAAIALGSVASLSTPFLDLIDSEIQTIADETGCLALVATLDADKMMLIKTWRPRTGDTIWLEPGYRIPVLGSSSGQAVIASMANEAFEAMDPSEEMRTYRQNGYDQLLKNGFTMAPEKTRYSSNVLTVSVPFYSEILSMPVGFSCGGTPATVSEERLCNDVGTRLRDLVKLLEQRTGQKPALTRRD